MTSNILIECGAAETRAAVVEGGVATHFWFGPARGDESLPIAPSAGDLYAGRVASVSKSLNAAFVDIGDERDAFLPFKKNEKPPVEGARGVYIVKRPSIDVKGAVLSTNWREGLDASAIASLEAKAKDGFVGALGETTDAAVSALKKSRSQIIVGDFEVFIDDPQAKRLLEVSGVRRVEFRARVFEEFETDKTIEDSLSSEVALTGGARMIFQETSAGVMIDIDTSAADGGAKLNDKTNEAAAARLFLELSRRDLGGRVIVDFLPPSTPGARAALEKKLVSGVEKFSRARAGRLQKDGLFDFTMPRERQSLLAALSEPAGAGFLIGGRRFTLDYSAKSAIRALERKLRAQPSARVKLLAGGEIADYIGQERPQWARRLADKFGARFIIEPHATREPRSYEVA